MTAQFGDLVVWSKLTRTVLGDLPVIEHPRIVGNPDCHGMSTACWRGSIATWAVVGKEFCLAQLDGKLRPEGPPLPATWITGVVTLRADPVDSYVQINDFDRYGPVCELDVRQGRSVRARRLAFPEQYRSGPPPFLWFASSLNATTRRRLRGTAPLLVGGKAKPPLAGIPERIAYTGRRGRTRCWRLRQSAGLRPGDVAERMGLPRARGGTFAEWERGQRQCPAADIAAVGAAVGLDDTARQALYTGDAKDYAGALAAFLDQPIPCTVLINGDHYRAPLDLPNDDESAIVWARSCVAVAWHKGILYLDRRRGLQIDLDGKVSPFVG